MIIGNRTEWSPIRSVIILGIKQIGPPLHGRPILLTTRMITDRIGLLSVLLPLRIKIISSSTLFCYCKFSIKPPRGLIFFSSTFEGGLINFPSLKRGAY